MPPMDVSALWDMLPCLVVSAFIATAIIMFVTLPAILGEPLIKQKPADQEKANEPKEPL
jgi:hypothetical protein